MRLLMLMQLFIGSCIYSHPDLFDFVLWCDISSLKIILQVVENRQ